MQTKILIALAMLVMLTNAQSLIKLPLTKSYFNDTGDMLTQNDGFLSDAEEASLDKTDNTYYTVQVNIGSGNQPFNLAIDTATPFIWVSTTNLQSNTDNHFDCNTSDTCELENHLFPIERDNGETIRGGYVEEPIQLGDDNNTVVQQHIILFNHNVSLLDNPADGVLGLGLKYTIVGISIGVTPLIDNLKDQEIIANRSFSIFLANDTMTTTNATNTDQESASGDGETTSTDQENADNEANPTQNTTQGEQSWLILGGYDPTLMTTDDFNYYPLAEDDQWYIKLVSFSFNDQQENVDDGEVLFDTRAGSTSFNEDSFNRLLGWAQDIDSTCDILVVAEVTTILCDCPNDTTTVSGLSFIFNEDDGQVYNLTSDQLWMPYNDRCILDVIKGDNNKEFILGHQFMVNYYMLYDVENSQIGIAPANHNQQGNQTSETSGSEGEGDGETAMPVEPNGGAGGE
jgi:hypothetical protein